MKTKNVICEFKPHIITIKYSMVINTILMDIKYLVTLTETKLWENQTKPEFQSVKRDFIHVIT